MRRPWRVGGVCLALVVQGCSSTSLRYDPAGVARREWGGAPPLAARPQDLRVRGEPLVAGQSYADDWRDLRASASAHLERAGLELLAGEGASDEQLRALLAEAERRGVPLLWVGMRGSHYMGSQAQWVYASFILGLLPGFAFCAIPLHSQRAEAGWVAHLVEPRTRELLGSFDGQAEQGDIVSAYSWDPPGLLPHVHRAALEALLEQVAAAVAQGYPGRSPLEDPLAFLRGRQAGPGGAATAPQAPAFLTRWQEIVKGVTTGAQVLELLGPPVVDGPDGARRLLFWTHSAVTEGSSTPVTSSLSVFLRPDGVVDEVRFVQTD